MLSPLRSLLFRITALVSVIALPQTNSLSNYAVFETTIEIPEGWVQLDTAVDLDATLSMRIHLAQQNVEEFERLVVDMSTPSHPNYGNHMTAEDIRLMLQPRVATVDGVISWLDRNGLATRAEVDNDWIHMFLTVREAEALLDAEYRLYQSVDDGRKVLRTLSYSIPKNLHEEIQMIQPTTMFGLSAQRSTIVSVEKATSEVIQNGMVSDASTIPASCNTTITPACLAELYKFDKYKAKGHGAIGVSGYLNRTAIHSDLQTFLAKYRPGVTADFKTVVVNGGTTDQDPEDINNASEANLDVQYTVGLAPNITNTFYSTGGSPPYIPDLDVTSDNNEPYADLLAYLLKQENLPPVLTTSYGESEQTVPLSYRKSVCNMFAQLGARGVSVIFSSGDTGPGNSCRSNDGKNTVKFLPQFPATCPFVTAVGGTVYIEPEQAVYFSSGGFSETWDMPSYQQSAVETYLAENKAKWEPFAKYFVKSGRAFPDVAAMADNFQVFIEGQEYVLEGTSCAAPTFASVVALLNDYRLSKGKKALGFLNPMLYANANAFTDITVGTSTGCTGYDAWGDPIAGNPGVVPGAGWAAVRGWDPVTGLGTPSFERFLSTFGDGIY